METAATPILPGGWQDRLITDQQGQTLRLLRDYLANRRADLRCLLDAGASPEEYALHEKLLVAVDAAENAAVTFWERFNKS